MELFEFVNEIVTTWGLAAPSSLRSFEKMLAAFFALGGVIALLAALAEAVPALRRREPKHVRSFVDNAGYGVLFFGFAALLWWGPLTASVGKIPTLDPIDAVGQAIAREHPEALWSVSLASGAILSAMLLVGAISIAVGSIRGDRKFRTFLVALSLSAAFGAFAAWSWHMGYGGGFERFCTAPVPDFPIEGAKRVYENDRASICPPRFRTGATESNSDSAN